MLRLRANASICSASYDLPVLLASIIEVRLTAGDGAANDCKVAGLDVDRVLVPSTL